MSQDYHYVVPLKNPTPPPKRTRETVGQRIAVKQSKRVLYDGITYPSMTHWGKAMGFMESPSQQCGRYVKKGMFMGLPLTLIGVDKSVKKREEVDIRPLKGFVIIKNLPDRKKTPGGIIIPESHKEKNMMGEIVTSSVRDLNKGDIILFGRYSGDEFKVGFSDEVFRKVDSEEIMAITDGTWEKISPVSDWLVVEPVDNSKEKLKNSIIVPGKRAVADDFNWGTVKVAGPGRVMKKKDKDDKHVMCKMEVKVGDKILFGPYCSYALKKFGVNLTMLRATSVEMVQSV